jgi:PAS domain S-box-containing protein
MPATLLITLADLATPQVITTTPDSAIEAAVQRMAAHKVSCILVVDGNGPVGLLSERDLVRLAHAGAPPTTPIRAVMSTPLVTAQGNVDFRTGHMLLMQHGIRHLVVIDERGGLIGLVSEGDFRRHLGHDVYERLPSLASVIESRPIQLAPDTPVSTALARMLADKQECVIVADQGRSLGILTERDLPRLLAKYTNPSTQPLRAVMSSPLHSVPHDTTVGQTVAAMARQGIRHMAVLDDKGGLAGVVTQHRLLEQLGSLLMEEGQSHLETKLAWLLDATEVGTWEYDHADGCLRCNGTLSAMLRESKASDDFNSWLSQLLASEPVGVPYWTADYQMPTPSGGIRWISLRGQSSYPGGQSRPAFSAGIAFEVTEAKRLQRDLEAERTRLRTLVSTAPDMIWLKDPDGVYLACNPVFEHCFGRNEADILDKTDFDLVDKAVAETLRDHDRQAMLADGPSVTQEWATFADDGHRALFETIRTPMRDNEGLLIGILGVARDITANYQNQERLANQVNELRRWHDATLGREMRILDLKREVNALLAERGQAPRYPSALDGTAADDGGTP